MATHFIGRGRAYGYAADDSPLPGERAVADSPDRSSSDDERGAPTTQQRIQATLARRHGDVAHRSSRHWTPPAPLAPPLREQARSWERVTATWAGRPISRWCRYGSWDEEGIDLTVTRIL